MSIIDDEAELTQGACIETVTVDGGSDWVTVLVTVLVGKRYPPSYSSTPRTPTALRGWFCQLRPVKTTGFCTVSQGERNGVSEILPRDEDSQTKKGMHGETSARRVSEQWGDKKNDRKTNG